LKKSTVWCHKSRIGRGSLVAKPDLAERGQKKLIYINVQRKGKKSDLVPDRGVRGRKTEISTRSGRPSGKHKRRKLFSETGHSDTGKKERPGFRGMKDATHFWVGHGVHRARFGAKNQKGKATMEKRRYLGKEK